MVYEFDDIERCRMPTPNLLYVGELDVSQIKKKHVVEIGCPALDDMIGKNELSNESDVEHFGSTVGEPCVLQIEKFDTCSTDSSERCHLSDIVILLDIPLFMQNEKKDEDESGCSAWYDRIWKIRTSSYKWTMDIMSECRNQIDEEKKRVEEMEKKEEEMEKQMGIRHYRCNCFDDYMLNSLSLDDYTYTIVEDMKFFTSMLSFFISGLVDWIVEVDFSFCKKKMYMINKETEQKNRSPCSGSGQTVRKPWRSFSLLFLLSICVNGTQAKIHLINDPETESSKNIWMMLSKAAQQVDILLILDAGTETTLNIGMTLIQDMDFIPGSFVTALSTDREEQLIQHRLTLFSKDLRADMSGKRFNSEMRQRLELSKSATVFNEEATHIVAQVCFILTTHQHIEMDTAKGMTFFTFTMVRFLIFGDWIVVLVPWIVMLIISMLWCILVLLVYRRYTERSSKLRKEVEVGWSDWNEWSVTCGDGRKSRNRLCNNPPPGVGGASCQGEELQEKACTIICLDFVEFWLQSIHFYTEEPGMVILVGTHADKLVQKDRKENVNRFFEGLRSHLCDKPYFVCLSEYEFDIDNSKVDPNLKDLKEAIFNVAKSNTSHWGELKPAKWLTLERRLHEMRQKAVKIIERDKLEEENRRLSVPLTGDELDLFLKFQHACGLLLYFSEQELEDYVILDPQWLIDAFKCFITADMFKQKNTKMLPLWKSFKGNAILTQEFIDLSWKQSKDRMFSDHKEHLLRLMEKLDIIAKPVTYGEHEIIYSRVSRISEESYFTPCMLKEKTPRPLLDTKQIPNSISTHKLCYTFDSDTVSEQASGFVPPAIFHRLIAACMSTWQPRVNKTKTLLFCDSGVFDLDSSRIQTLTLYLRDNFIQMWMTSYSQDQPNANIKTREQVECFLQKLYSNCSNLAMKTYIKCPETDCCISDGMIDLLLFIKHPKYSCPMHEEGSEHHNHLIQSAEVLCNWTVVDIDEFCESNICDEDGRDEPIFHCFEGYTGDQCDAEVDPCIPDPFDNGRLCNETGTKFTCACINGYTGETCTEEPAEITDTQGDAKYTSNLSVEVCKWMIWTLSRIPILRENRVQCNDEGSMGEMNTHQNVKVELNVTVETYNNEEIIPARMLEKTSDKTSCKTFETILCDLVEIKVWLIEQSRDQQHTNQPEMQLAIRNDSTVYNVQERTPNQVHNEVLKDIHVIHSARSEQVTRELEDQENNNGEDSELHVVGDEKIGESTNLVDELTENIEELQAYQNDERTESNEFYIVYKEPELCVGLDNPGLPGSSMPLTDDVHSAAEESNTETVFCGLQEEYMFHVDTGNSATNKDRETYAKRLNFKKDLKGQSLKLKVVQGNNDSQSEGRVTNPKHQLQKSKFHDIPLRQCPDGMKRDIDAVCDMKEIERFNWRIAQELPVPKYNITVALLTEGQTFEPLNDIMTKIADGNAPGPQVTMRYELLRICTLRNYPKDNKPYLIQLAAAGFYYAAEGDEVICYCCGLRRHSWVGTDVPERIHRRINPNCKYLNRKLEFNVPVAFTGTTANLEKLEIFWTMLNEEPVSSRAVTAEGGNDVSEYATANPAFRGGASTDLGSPKHPQHILKSQRISSFQGWPDSLAHTPEIMAEAGFYYAGFGDCVRCYYCGIGLRHWAPEDNPWIEHARWSKNCAFIKNVKGEEFVHLVQMAVQYSQNEEGNQATGTSEESSEQAAENRPNERELVDKILKSDPAQSVLDMGYQPKMIKKAIEFILKRDGRPGISSQTIMEKVLEYEEAETNTNIVGELANMDLNRHDNPSGEAEARSTDKSASKVNENEDKSLGKDKKKPQLDKGNGPKPSEARSIKEENKKLKEQTLCKICLDKPVCIVFLPCGHLCTCDSCAPAMRVCPICRTDVKGTVKTYMS